MLCEGLWSRHVLDGGRVEESPLASAGMMDDAHPLVEPTEVVYMGPIAMARDSGVDLCDGLSQVLVGLGEGEEEDDELTSC